MALALLKMLDISNGSIIIDGIDLSTVPSECVRSRVNSISQDPFFLPGDIRFNMDFTKTSSDDQIIGALRDVDLWDILESTGLDGDMDPKLLSFGQRQLFCLARAILRPQRIVILDEVTSR